MKNEVPPGGAGKVIFVGEAGGRYGNFGEGGLARMNFLERQEGNLGKMVPPKINRRGEFVRNGRSWGISDYSRTVREK